MNRLQKKCFIVSTSLHVLLVIVLLFGAALMPRPDDESNFKPITLYSSSDVSDAPTSAPGPVAPTITAVQPTPTPPAKVEPPPATKPVVQPPAPKPEPKVEVQKPREKPEPVRQVERTKPEPRDKPQDSWDWFHWPKKKTDAKDEAKDTTPAPPTKHKVVIDPNSLKTVKRKASETAQDTSEANNRAAKAERQRAAREFASALTSISKNISTSTLVTMPSGGGGTLSANYSDIIASKYYNAWVVPPDLDSSATVKVSVTIGRDGNVISSHILRSSGNRLLDQSIQRALDAVDFIEPFPDSFREQQRTVTINFNPQIKLQTG